MTDRVKGLIYSYLLNREAHLEHDVRQLSQNVRYRQIGTVDCIELLLALERLESFREFSGDIRVYLGFDKNRYG